MATARNFGVLFSLVQTICQDQSINGQAQAQAGINTIIKELTREFRFPEMFKGYDNSVFVQPTAKIGVQQLSLAADVSRLENVWWIDSSQTNWMLDEVTTDADWLSLTDLFTTEEPEVYRYFQPNASYTVPQIQIWPAANSAWISQSGGKLYYSYWAQLVQLVNSIDVPNIPYELDTVLVNGGVLEMARMQGDDTLMSIYGPKYEDDKGHVRMWIVKQKTRDGTVTPDAPSGAFGSSQVSSGYKISGGMSPI